MEKQQLGTTDLFISQVGAGVGGILGIKIFNEQQALNVIQYTIDENIIFLIQVVRFLWKCRSSVRYSSQ